MKIRISDLKRVIREELQHIPEADDAPVVGGDKRCEICMGPGDLNNALFRASDTFDSERYVHTGKCAETLRQLDSYDRYGNDI